MKKLLSIILFFALAITSEAHAFTESETIEHFTFGFRENDASTLRAKFNDAILSMKLDGTLDILQVKYLDSYEPVIFRNYNAEDTIKVAVTDENFTRAILAEIGRRLRVNIEIVDINPEEKISALISGNVDTILLDKPAISDTLLSLK